MTTQGLQVECERHHAGVPVEDVAAAAAYYTGTLGFSLGFTWGDPPTFAGVTLGDVQIFLEQDDDAVGGGASVYFVVGDADALYEFHRVRGADVVRAPGDRAWGLRDYTIRDPYGHRLTFGHHLSTAGPPIEIERVDVPVRLETRVASVLRDLAAHKRMSVSSCLEETLLHTFEPFGDGVASPHTRQDLRHIQALKEKHGIDFDSHASYRFVERASVAMLDFAARYTDAWCSQDPSRVASFYTADGTLTVNDGAPAVGRAAIAGAAQGFMTAFPDLVVRMDRVDADDDRVTYHWTLTGSHTGPGGTGRAVRISGRERWRFGGDGLIAESIGSFDEADYRRQLSGPPDEKERAATQAHDDGAVPAEGSRPRERDQEHR
jgi:uncharacterized protein (TIGR02246 family)